MNGSLFQLIFFFVKIKSQYNALASDEEMRNSSVRLGVMSIINSVIWAAVAVAGAIGMYYSFDFLDSTIFIGIIMVIICVAVVIISLVYLIFGSMAYFIYQLKLNRKPIGFIALAIWLLCVGGGIVLVLYFCDAGF